MNRNSFTWWQTWIFNPFSSFNIAYTLTRPLHPSNPILLFIIPKHTKTGSATRGTSRSTHTINSIMGNPTNWPATRDSTYINLYSTNQFISFFTPPPTLLPFNPSSIVGRASIQTSSQPIPHPHQSLLHRHINITPPLTSRNRKTPISSNSLLQSSSHPRLDSISDLISSRRFCWYPWFLISTRNNGSRLPPPHRHPCNPVEHH